MTKRISVSPTIRRCILQESGFRCANPVCRMALTLEIHHIEPISEDGGNTQDNLIALCPNCHALYHKGIITPEAVKTWKMILLSLNEGFDRRSVDLLLFLGKQGEHFVSGDGVLEFASLIASDLVSVAGGVKRGGGGPWSGSIPVTLYEVRLTDKGRRFVENWKKGDQQGAIGQLQFQIKK